LYPRPSSLALAESIPTNRLKPSAEVKPTAAPVATTAGLVILLVRALPTLLKLEKVSVLALPKFCKSRVALDIADENWLISAPTFTKISFIRFLLSLKFSAKLRKFR